MLWIAGDWSFRPSFTATGWLCRRGSATRSIPVAELCRKHGISEATFYNWKARFGGLDVSEAKRLKALEDENGKLKRLLADAMLDNVVLKDLLSKKW